MTTKLPRYLLAYKPGVTIDPNPTIESRAAGGILYCACEDVLWARGHLMAAAIDLWSHVSTLQGEDPKARVEAQHREFEVVDAPYVPGRYHRRVWRRPIAPSPESAGTIEAWVSSNVIASGLFEQLRRIFEVVEPVPSNAQVHGHELRHLILLACAEVESAFRGILRDNGEPHEATKTRDYVRLCEPMRLREWVVELAFYPQFGRFAPFRSWASSSATKTLLWYETHHELKHNRELNLPKATLHCAVEALAAVYIMLAAQFGPAALSDVASSPATRFRIVEEPRWLPVERYWQPRQGDFGVERPEWTAVPLPLPPAG